MTTPYTRHMRAITADEIMRGNIIGLRKALSAQARKDAGWSVSRTAPNITATEIGALVEAIEAKQPRVGRDLHDSGLAVLRNRRHAKRLASVADIIADLDHFRLVGFTVDNVPVFKAVGRDGRSFRFCNPSWQSGGNGPEIF